MDRMLVVVLTTRRKHIKENRLYSNWMPKAASAFMGMP
jgi:hypothetical protein